jgi:hypothetical protein
VFFFKVFFLRNHENFISHIYQIERDNNQTCIKVRTFVFSKYTDGKFSGALDAKLLFRCRAYTCKPNLKCLNVSLLFRVGVFASAYCGSKPSLIQYWLNLSDSNHIFETRTGLPQK